jgi:hypothetical protein
MSPRNIEDKMSNAININVVEITATFDSGLVSLSFAKDGKIIKVCNASDASRFVRPENLSKVTALVAAVKESDEAKAYWAARKVEIDAKEAEYQARTGNYAAYQYGKTPASSDTMRKAMAVQG